MTKGDRVHFAANAFFWAVILAAPILFCVAHEVSEQRAQLHACLRDLDAMQSQTIMGALEGR